MSELITAHDALVARLEDENAHLLRQNRELRRELDAAKKSSAAGAAELRRVLTPLYRALQTVFGELDAIGADDTPSVSDPRVSAVWASWKSKMPGRTAQVIDALLLHGPMNYTQIGIAIGIHRNNVPAILTRLKQAGLIEKNGGNYQLKAL